MADVFIASHNILSPLGCTSKENFNQLARSVTALRLHVGGHLSPEPLYASLFENRHFVQDDKSASFTTFEELLIRSVNDALQLSGIDTGKDTVFVVSSTKGNISMLGEEADRNVLKNKVSLHSSAKAVAAYFGFVNEPLVVSNACISGLVAILTARRLIQSGRYKNAVVSGADILSKFIVSGFQSFQAISNERCKPFDAARNGINLGEGAGTVVLSSDQKWAGCIKVSAGSISNDANHISGPSRTGEELSQAISNALDESGLRPEDIDFISAHGTATVYNDEMEAKAISLSGMEAVPVNSLKGFYGHTLGAAGLIESIISIESLKEDMVLPTLGFNRSGVTKPINICSELQSLPLKNCLKTASGFGGCNAALVFSKQ